MKSTGLELGQFLNEQRALGTSDSEGQFTVSHSNAARKLARFSLPRPYAWVSKVVQAACAWEVDEICLLQERALTSFFLKVDHPERLPDEKELVEALLSGQIGGERPMDDFSMALRSLAEQTKLSFLVTIDNGASESRPVYAGNFFARMKESHRLAPRHRRGPGITLNVAHIPADETESSLLVGSRYARKIVDELETYCYLCTVPLTLGEHRRDGPFRSGRFASSKDFKPLLLSGVNNGHPMALSEGFEEKKMSLFTHPERTKRTYQGKTNFSSGVLVGVDQKALLSPFETAEKLGGSLHWVHRGVVVQTDPLPLKTQCLRCEFFLNADGLKRDLTGFKLVTSEKKAQREAESVRALARLVCSTNFYSFAFRVDQDEDSPLDEVEDKKDATLRNVKYVLKRSWAGAILTFLYPALGIPVALGGLAVALAPRKDHDEIALSASSETFGKMVQQDQQTISDILMDWTPQDPGEQGSKVEFF